jgi:hypothetical protein
VSFPIRDSFEYFFGCKRLALWHRNWAPDEYRAVDIDLIGTERGEIAYVIESTTSPPAGKQCSVTKNIAKATSAHALIVQIPKIEAVVADGVPWRQVADYYQHMPPPSHVTIRQVWPSPEWQKRMTWTDFVDFLGSCRSTSVSGTTPRPASCR